MTAGSWPKPTPFDLESGVDDEVLSLLFGGPDAELAGVLLLAGQGARADGWAARTTIALATAWSERSGTVILADACLESPELHGLLAEQNGEGVADVFQFGASLRRVRRTLEGHPFEFIPAGVYVLDPEGVMRHGAWTRLLEDTLSMGRRLMVYAAAGAPGVDTLAERIGAVVLLAAEDDEVDATSLQADLRAVLRPSTPSAGGAAARTAARRPDAEFQRLRLPQGEKRDSHIADLRMQQRATVLGRPTEQADAAAGRMTPPLPTERVAVAEPESDLEQPVFRDPPERGRRRAGPLLLTLLIVLLFSLLAGAWHFFGRSWLAARNAPAVAPVADSLAAVPPTLPIPAGPVQPLPVSIAMEAYTSLPEALERQRALAAIEADVGFLISPTLVDSTLYYRVFAGPLPDSVVADSLLERMVRSGSKSARFGNEIHTTPLAFVVGEFEDQASARARQLELEQLDIPTYTVRLAQPDGDRYRLYAGAYNGRGEADVMRQILRNAGVRDSLVTRVGSSAQ